MKNSGCCPKCEGAELIRLPGVGGMYGNGVSAGLRSMPVTRYICYTCGFSEEWVESRNDLRRLRDKHGLWQEDPAAQEAEESVKRQLGLL